MRMNRTFAADRFCNGRLRGRIQKWVRSKCPMKSTIIAVVFCGASAMTIAAGVDEKIAPCAVHTDHSIVQAPECHAPRHLAKPLSRTGHGSARRSLNVLLHPVVHEFNDHVAVLLEEHLVSVPADAHILQA